MSNADKPAPIPTWKICPECHLAPMRDHPEWPEKYWKCPICGYTEERPPKPRPPYKIWSDK